MTQASLAVSAPYIAPKTSCWLTCHGMRKNLGATKLNSTPSPSFIGGLFFAYHSSLYSPSQPTLARPYLSQSTSPSLLIGVFVALSFFTCYLCQHIHRNKVTIMHTFTIL